jgi:hypothetical protein
MNSEERARLDSLCKQIAIEQDYSRFNYLLEGLNALLDSKSQRLKTPPKPTSKITTS